MPTKQQQLEQIAADILSQNVCPDLAKQATQLVMGDGNLNADILFIGEAPGKKEDLEGRPFIGASGKFLNLMLEQAGMKREDVYITNIVKYRPPENRDPTPAEKAAFLPYLLRQIEVISPKVIITLGRHSMDPFLPKAKISDLHGHPQTLKLSGKEVMLIPLFHPAAALFNGSKRQTLFDDFVRVPELISSLHIAK